MALKIALKKCWLAAILGLVALSALSDIRTVGSHKSSDLEAATIPVTQDSQPLARADRSAGKELNLAGVASLSISAERPGITLADSLRQAGAADTIRVFTSVESAQVSGSSTDSITYTYDSLNRLTSASYASGDTITYAYDAAGNRTSIQVVTNNVLTNDNFANAQVITGSSGSLTDSNVGATKEPGEPNHVDRTIGASVWYRWQSPGSGSSVITTAASDYDTLLAVYTGSSVSALSAIASNDDDPAGGFQSIVTFDAIAGTVYYIAVDGFGGATGNINLSWSLSAPPSTLRIDIVTPAAGRTSGGQQTKLSGAFINVSSVTVGGVSASWSYTNGTSEVTLTTPPHAVGAVSIDLASTAGSAYSKSNAFAYLPTTFTDDTLLARVTMAKAQHIIELRQAVDALRAVAGLGPAPWADPVLPPFNTVIKGVHILELRSYLEDAAARLGYPAGSYADGALTPGFLIKRLHIEELRQRIRTIAG